MLRETKVLLQTLNSIPLLAKALTKPENSRPLLSLASEIKKSIPGPLVTTTIFAFGSAFKWFCMLFRAPAAVSIPVMR